MTDSPITDVARVRGLLIGAAREGRAVSYSELLGDLGLRFTRPKMRAVCKTLDVIDEAAIAAGEPELAVLVVRESDRLPGQGWWGGSRAFVLGYDGRGRGRPQRSWYRNINRSRSTIGEIARILRRRAEPSDKDDRQETE